MPPLYRYITFPSSFWRSLTIFGISKSNFQRDQKKIPLLVRTFRGNLSTVFWKLPHIPPEEIFKFAPYLTYFLTRFLGRFVSQLKWLVIYLPSGSRWETYFVHSPSQVVAGETKLFMRASAAIFQNGSPSGSQREWHFGEWFQKKSLPVVADEKGIFRSISRKIYKKIILPKLDRIFKTNFPTTCRG